MFTASATASLWNRSNYSWQLTKQQLHANSQRHSVEAMTDRKIGQAMALTHKQPEAPLTVAELATQGEMLHSAPAVATARAKSISKD